MFRLLLANDISEWMNGRILLPLSYQITLTTEFKLWPCGTSKLPSSGISTILLCFFKQIGWHARGEVIIKFYAKEMSAILHKLILNQIGGSHFKRSSSYHSTRLKELPRNSPWKPLRFLTTNPLFAIKLGFCRVYYLQTLSAPCNGRRIDREKNAGKSSKLCVHSIKGISCGWSEGVLIRIQIGSTTRVQTYYYYYYH